MDLMGRVESFMVLQQQRLSGELAEKYGVPTEEVNDAVSLFLHDTYDPALRAADQIAKSERPVALFIGRESCAICRKTSPELEKFLQDHSDLQLVRLDYSSSEGLLYHMIAQEETGRLPLVALIFNGAIGMLYTGRCVEAQVFESHYLNLMSQCSQNIYAL
jgi:hypothetical protein